MYMTTDARDATYVATVEEVCPVVSRNISTSTLCCKLKTVFDKTLLIFIGDLNTAK